MWGFRTPFVLLLVSVLRPASCQSGDGDWGSGFGLDSTSNWTSQVAGDEPVRPTNGPSSPPTSTQTPKTEASSDRCSLHFNADPALARRLKAEREELAYLQAIQRGNRAVMENLEQYVGAELGDQSYEDVIKENIAGTREDQRSCQEVVDKAVEDLEKRLEGDMSQAQAEMQKIRADSQLFDDMLEATAAIAGRLEISSKTLHASFTKQLRHIGGRHR